MSNTTLRNLLDEIESSPSRYDETSVWSLSGAGFVIRSGTDIIYIDCWLVPPDSSRTTHRTYRIPFPPENVLSASAILATHEHEDHCNVATLIGLNKNSHAPLVGPTSVVIKATRGGFPETSVHTVRAGDVVEHLKGFKLRVFKAHDPYEESAVMYLIETAAGNIFHSGDSAYFEGFKEIGDSQKVDIALLNFGKQIPSPEKPYYMNAQKVALAARDLRARIVVPMHWNLWVETREDPAPIKDTLKEIAPDSKLEILEGGHKLELHKQT
jgi:L-ascorbate metabolism protein UlaG (beta-lactamase superfamily)